MTPLQTRAARPTSPKTQFKPGALTNLYLTLPVALLYHLGVVFVDRRNSADLVTDALLSIVGGNRLWYVAMIAVVAMGVWFLTRTLSPRGRMRAGTWQRLFVESVLLSAMLPLVAVLVTRSLVDWLSLSVGAIDGVVRSAGAGFHEELLFRVVLFGGLCGLLQMWTKRSTLAVLGAALISSVLFSLAHHALPGAPPVTTTPFIFRTVAGLCLCAIYRTRGFAVAVYAHALYDVYVLVL